MSLLAHRNKNKIEWYIYKITRSKWYTHVTAQHIINQSDTALEKAIVIVMRAWLRTHVPNSIEATNHERPSILRARLMSVYASTRILHIREGFHKNRERKLVCEYYIHFK